MISRDYSSSEILDRINYVSVSFIIRSNYVFKWKKLWKTLSKLCTMRTKIAWNYPLFMMLGKWRRILAFIFIFFMEFAIRALFLPLELYLAKDERREHPSAAVQISKVIHCTPTHVKAHFSTCCLCILLSKFSWSHVKIMTIFRFDKGKFTFLPFEVM